MRIKAADEFYHSNILNVQYVSCQRITKTNLFFSFGYFKLLILVFLSNKKKAKQAAYFLNN